mmetsp:Transcript_3748/g.5504  ORF Transcript_3748/g.5504 Transcript_3748/m.5504 type:complete len:231 (+) Transcript_3748:58-750(+)
MTTTESAAAVQNLPSDPATTATSSPQWPPVSIATDTDAIIDECESMEMSVETSSQPFLAVVQMAALLYHGDLVNARHLWRRLRTTPTSSETSPTNDQYLEDWWNVGRHMMEMNINGVWEALHKCATQHPVPICGYAHQVVHAYRLQLLEKFAPRDSTVTPPLGFNNAEELNEYLRKHGWQPQQQPSGSTNVVMVAPSTGITQNSSSSSDMVSPEDLTAVVSFLETSKLNV